MKILKTGILIFAFILSSTMAFAASTGSGDFSGVSGHKTTGKVTVSKSNGEITVTLGESFSFDGAPDPYVALGNGINLVSGGLLRILKNNTGRQTYSISTKSIDLAQVNSVVIWCKKYAVPLGVAKIK